MFSTGGLRAEFAAAILGASAGLDTAERICAACVTLLQVDGASISLMHAGTTFGTYGSTSELSRRLDEYQFTFGEGPCLDAVRQERPVLVPDLRDPDEQRWPVYAGAVLDEGVHAVYALPVSISSACVGALDLFRAMPGPLTDTHLVGALVAADLARMPLLDLIADAVTDQAGPPGEADEDSWVELAALEHVEVYQATGMIMVQLGVDPAEALVRLRAHAFARGMTAMELAQRIVRRQYHLDEPHTPERGHDAEGGT